MKINLSKLIYTFSLLEACATNVKNLEMINEEKINEEKEKSQIVKHINSSGGI